MKVDPFFRVTRWGYTAAALAAILLVWEVFGRAFEIRTDLLPTPSRIFLEIGRAWSTLFENAGVTTLEVLCALSLSALLALPLSITLGISPVSAGWTRTFLRPTYAMPLMAAAPLVLVWFGFSKMSKVFLASLLCFFPFIASISRGLNSPSPDILELMRLMGADRIQCFFKIRLPASLPHLFGGLKLAVLYAVSGVIVEEFVGAESGLGHLMLAAQAKLNTPLLFAALLTTLLIPAVLCGLVMSLQRVIIPWGVDQAGRRPGSSETETAPAAASTIRMEKPSA